MPSLLSWLGVSPGSDKTTVLVESCARDSAWYAYTALRASEVAQPDMSLELWTELQAEMSASNEVSVEQALSVCHCKHTTVSVDIFSIILFFYLSVCLTICPSVCQSVCVGNFIFYTFLSL